MKVLYQLFMTIQVGLYRLSGGKLGGSMRGFKILLLTTTGRKSGKQHTVPVGYYQQPGGYLIVASYGGGPKNPGWYHNLKSKPQVTIQVDNQIMAVTAQVLTGEARDQAWREFVTAAPLYANYETKTTRQIPVVLLRPNL